VGGVAHAGAEVVAVQEQQRLAGQEAEPEERGQGRPGEVLRGAAGDLEVGLLEDVGRVEPPPQPPVEAEADHLPQPLAVPEEQLAQGRFVPPLDASEQVLILAPVFVRHSRPPFQDNCAPAPIVHRRTVAGKKNRGGLWTIGPANQLVLAEARSGRAPGARGR
jgi:hypothetical protein